MAVETAEVKEIKVENLAQVKMEQVELLVEHFL